MTSAYTHQVVIQYNRAGEPRAPRLLQQKQTLAVDRALLQHIASTETRQVYIYMQDAATGRYALAHMNELQNNVRLLAYMSWRAPPSISNGIMTGDAGGDDDAADSPDEKKHWPLAVYALVQELNYCLLKTLGRDTALIQTETMGSAVGVIDSVTDATRPDYQAYDGADIVRWTRRFFRRYYEGRAPDIADPYFSDYSTYTPSRWPPLLLCHALRRVVRQAEAQVHVAIAPLYRGTLTDEVESALKLSRFYIMPTYVLRALGAGRPDIVWYSPLRVAYSGTTYVLWLYGDERTAQERAASSSEVHLELENTQRSQPWYSAYHVLSLVRQIAQSVREWERAIANRDTRLNTRRYVTESLRALRPDVGVDAVQQDLWDAQRMDDVDPEMMWQVLAARALFDKTEQRPAVIVKYLNDTRLRAGYRQPQYTTDGQPKSFVQHYQEIVADIADAAAAVTTNNNDDVTLISVDSLLLRK